MVSAFHPGADASEVCHRALASVITLGNYNSASSPKRFLKEAVPEKAPPFVM